MAPHALRALERLRDSFAGYFQRYDALLCPVTPFPATRHGLADLVIDGKTVSPFHVMSATSPFSLTGMLALSMRFGTSHDGLPIGVQIVASWLAESTVLKVASLLEEVSPVRNLHPALQRRRAEDAPGLAEQAANPSRRERPIQRIEATLRSEALRSEG